MKIDWNIHIPWITYLLFSVILIILKATEVLSIDWWVVMMPFWIPLSIVFVMCFSVITTLAMFLLSAYMLYSMNETVSNKNFFDLFKKNNE